MKVMLYTLVMFAYCQVCGATASWLPVHRIGWSLESVDPLITITDVNGGVRADDGGGASVTGMIFVRTGADGTFIKAYDYSSTAAPVRTSWLLALCGDILDTSTLRSYRAVESTITYDFGTGGDRVVDPSNFYLVFVAEDWDDYVSGVENPHMWYGWVNFSANSDGALDVLGSDVDIYGNPMIVGGGATPEPSSLILFLVGLALLVLRRGVRSSRGLNSTFPPVD